MVVPFLYGFAENSLERTRASSSLVVKAGKGNEMFAKIRFIFAEVSAQNDYLERLISWTMQEQDRRIGKAMLQKNFLFNRATFKLDT